MQLLNNAGLSPPRLPHFALPARKHLHTRNLVARLNLPNMAYAPEDKLEIYARPCVVWSSLSPIPRGV